MCYSTLCWRKRLKISGTHGETFGGGSAIAVAAVFATIDVIDEEGLVENTAETLQKFEDGLKLALVETAV